jgi:hypothetical protein
MGNVAQQFESAQDRVFGRWIPCLGTGIVSALRTGLSVAGIGGALAIASQAGGRALQYNWRAADIAGYIGRRRRPYDGGMTNIGFGPTRWRRWSSRSRLVLRAALWIRTRFDISQEWACFTAWEGQAQRQWAERALDGGSFASMAGFERLRRAIPMTIGQRTPGKLPQRTRTNPD